MKRITVKVGSSFFIDEKGNVNVPMIDRLVGAIKSLKENGTEVCLVSSGAIAVGLKKMKLKRKPTATNKKQALAAIGQMELMQVYEQAFDRVGIKCAQILLTHDDFGSRTRENNLKATFNALFEMGAVPVVNENDATSTAEIKVGDNDTLSAMTSLVIESELLILVSDVEGLYTANPNVDASAKLITKVDKIDQSIYEMAKSPAGEFGTGGMATKIKAAQIATSAGIGLVITSASKVDQLLGIAQGQSIGTFFAPCKERISLKKCWLKFMATISGNVTLDAGATTAVVARRSLLLCGVTKVGGEFTAGAVVNLLNADGKVIAVGEVELSASALKKAMKESRINVRVCHADDIVVL